MTFSAAVMVVDRNVVASAQMISTSNIKAKINGITCHAFVELNILSLLPNRAA